LVFFWAVPAAMAHGVADGDKGYVQAVSGPQVVPFIYLGAKHMVTGYDHLLFLLGVIFFLHRLKDVALYVSLFALGHVLTLLSGVLMTISFNASVVDAIIGFSVVYKALDNMGAFKRWFGVQPDTRVATFVFGLVHGFGLAAKLIDYELSEDGLVTNLISFNVGVEVGQLLALWFILIAMNHWRRSASFVRHAYAANVVVMMLGFLLMGLHITGFFVS
jgi:hypothetical protein